MNNTTSHSPIHPDIDVLIAGAGPSGTTLAIDLARRGVRVRIMDKAQHAFNGSRAKGVQPRTQEVFDDIGVIDEALTQGAQYPPAGLHLGPVTIPWRMQKQTRPSSDIPYPNTLLLPQFRTDAMLHRALAAYGTAPEFGVALVSYVQDDSGVTSMLSTGEIVRAHYLVGADGGSSTVRKGAGIAFTGTTNAEDRTLIVDANIEGLSRNRWHMWAKPNGRSVGACPLPHSRQFQIMMRLAPDEEADLTEQALAARFRSLTGHALSDITWTSLFRPNVRLAEHYRSGRAILIGDAAHVHTPAGAQGLNTGVQDAYNLGWKLGQVIAGDSPSLLDTYEAERRPIAASVLGRSSELYAGIERGGVSSVSSLKRGDTERQLSLSYSGGPLAAPDAPSTTSLHVGDRAPDAPCTGSHSVTPSGTINRLFDALRGPHFTLLTFGERATAASETFAWPTNGAPLRSFAVIDSDRADGLNCLIDTTGKLRKQYGISGDTAILIRPDGYIATIAVQNWAAALQEASRIFI